MITERDLQEAIAECIGQRHPDANTCIKLAAFLTIREYLFGARAEEEEPPRYSFDPAPTQARVELNTGTEFAEAIRGKTIDETLELFDELMATLSILNRSLYDSVLRKIQ